MSHDADACDARTLALARSIHIPPRPDVLRLAQEEALRAEPDLARMAALIGRDPALAACVLKTVNSPACGLTRPVGSIPQAVHLLGVRAVTRLVAGAALRQALGTAGEAMPRYWDTAASIAVLCAMVARELGTGAADDAYTVGLFHDCGIPLMARRFPDYKALLAHANRDPREALTVLEERRFGTHHGVVGYYMARTWNLPAVVCEAVLRHHDLPEALGDADHADAETRALDGALMGLAVATRAHRRWRGEPDDPGWPALAAVLLDRLGLSEFDYLDLEDRLLARLAEPDAA